LTRRQSYEFVQLQTPAQFTSFWPPPSSLRSGNPKKEAANLSANEPFELVLSLLRTPPGAIADLARLLEGSHAEFLYTHPVEEGQQGKS